MADENMNTIHITEKQKVQEITDKLEEGLKELFESEKYKTYLSTMSKFHNYSFNNTLLIAMQRPEATLVAGYKAWQKNFERHVNKGEKSARFREKAENQTSKVMAEIEKLQKLSNKKYYTYSTEQINELFGAIQSALDETKATFTTTNAEKKKLFTFSA